MNRSNFTAEKNYQLDTFIEFYDIQASELTEIDELQTLFKKQNRTEEETTRLNTLVTKYRNRRPSAEDFNYFCDCLKNIEQKVFDDITIVQNTINTGVTTINTSKDNALLSIENKKNNIIEYMDGTTAGALRNDIGIMDESTISGANLIEKTNNLSNEIDILSTQELESTGYGIISGLTVTAQSSPNMTVNVASGIVHMANGIRLAPLGNSALPINIADVINPRIDIIYVNSDSTIGYLAGTPSATPVAPSTPTGAFLLDEIYVGANVITIVNGNITDKRKMKVTTEGLHDTINEHLADNLYQTAGGTATAITLTGVVLENGHPKTFIASANNSGSATTINGKHLYKPGTTTAPTLKVGKAYTVWYNLTGDCFFIKASATGTALPSDVLAGVPYSTEDDTDLVGIMPNKVGSATVITPSTVDQVIPQGYFGGVVGDGKVLGEPNYLASNILNTANLWGLQGTAIAGKRSANGVATSSSATSIFQLATNTSNTSFPTITVTGLPFKPSLVIIKRQVSGTTLDEIIYSEFSPDFYAKIIKTVDYYTGTTSSTSSTKCVKGDVLTANVYNGGFVLPAIQTNTEYTWYAIE